MDTTTQLHLLGKLDALRETQVLHGEILRELRALLQAAPAISTKTEDASTRLTKWIGLLKPLLVMAAQSAGGVLAVAYAIKGGDLMTAITALTTLVKTLSGG